MDDPSAIASAARSTVPPRRPAWRALLPAAAFLCGFLWDALTLGRAIRSTDLLILVTYLVAAGLILVLMGRGIRFRGSSRLNIVLQFLFGGVFSALVVLYFVSSGGVFAFLVVVGLAGMLVANEFLAETYERLTISWAVFGVCVVMLLNFVIPHLAHSIHPFWFFVSLGVGTGLVFVLKGVSRDERATAWPTLAVAVLLAALHALNLIPPVPLASRAMVVGSEVRRDGGDWVIRGREAPPIWILSPRTLVRDEPGPVYCFTAIFAPPGINTIVTHRWRRLDEVAGKWVTTDTLSFPIRGGRQGGYRGHSLKRNIRDGSWMVVAESESGIVIASTRFDVRTGDEGPARAFERRF